MIGTQTKALFLDAYRELNARKMFWIVLILNVVVIAAFAALGVNGNHITIFAWKLPEEMPGALFFYKWAFSNFIVGLWLTWIATVMALISTASVFPDFMAGGTIDLYLSKPVGRARLFFTKYVAGLLFVTLQVGVFTLGSFVVLGARGGVWEPGLFLAIPIVVLFFSYLFCICVLLGVYTRSTLAAFFLTLVVWFLIWGVNTTDRIFAQIDDRYQDRAEMAQTEISRLDQRIADLKRAQSRGAATGSATTAPAAATEASAAVESTTSTDFTAAGESAQSRQLRILQRQRDAAVDEASNTTPPPWTHVVQKIIFWCDTLIPKTQETIGLLDRALFTDVDLKSLQPKSPDTPRAERRQFEALVHGRSLLWILGSSLAFEGVILALACRRFCRLDY